MNPSRKLWTGIATLTLALTVLEVAAVGVMARLFAGEESATSAPLAKGIALLLATPPKWDAAGGAIDFPYWFFATVAMEWTWGRGGTWGKWRESMLPVLAKSRRIDGGVCVHAGSWDPADAWGQDGGRIAATAFGASILAIGSMCYPPPGR